MNPLQRPIGEVVKLRRRRTGEVVQGCDVYVGRRMTMGGWDLPQTEWANPFKVDKRDPFGAHKSVLQYWKWIHEPGQAPLLSRIPELSGKVLGCWCKKSKAGKEPCHGDVLLFLSGGPMSMVLDNVLRMGGIDPDKVKRVEASGEIGEVPETKEPPRAAKDRVRAGFIGLILGDALGVPHEFPKWGNFEYTGRLQHLFIYRAGQRWGHPNRHLTVGQYSDDSEMAIALARSIVAEQGYDRKKVVEAYIEWANSGTPMMGTNTRKLFKVRPDTLRDPGGFDHYSTAYRKEMGFVPGVPFLGPGREDKQSNGSLMRSFPLACLYDEKALDQDVWLSNPSRVVRDLTSIYIRAIRLALRGVSAKEIWEDVVKVSQQVPIALEIMTWVTSGQAKDMITYQGKKAKGWVGWGFYAAMTCLGYLSTNPDLTFSQLMKWVIADHPGSDTDTNACIAGALVGSILGWNKLISDPLTLENIPILINSTTQEVVAKHKADQQLEDKNIVYRPPKFQLTDLEDLISGLSRLSSMY